MKILICADGSKINENAMKYGAILASAVKAEVTILHVIEGKKDRTEEIFKEAKKILEKKEVKKIKTETLHGRADVAIIKHAKKHKYDLVIMGSHGMQSLKIFLTGDVAARVIEYIKTPILVVREKRKKLERILFCTGGSSYAENAIKFGSTIAKAANAKATILHVVPYIPVMYQGLGIETSIAEFLKCETPECIAVKRAASILEKKGIDTDVKLSHGQPSEEILSQAAKGNYDLIVMGSHGMTSPTRFLLGDVAYKVVKHSRIPCLLVKPKQ